MAFPLTSNMVLGLLDQLLIFCQLCLIKLLGLLTEFGMLVFFTNLSLMGFQVRYLAIFLLFSVIGGLRWFSIVKTASKKIGALIPSMKFLSPEVA